MRPLPKLAVWRRVRFHLSAALLLTITILGWSNQGLAQDVRRIKTSVQPHYPDLARQMKVTGSTRLEVLIAKDGTVKNIKVLGGCPILVQASVDAVKQWKYEAAAVESKSVLKFDFN